MSPFRPALLIVAACLIVPTGSRGVEAGTTLLGKQVLKVNGCGKQKGDGAQRLEVRDDGSFSSQDLSGAGLALSGTYAASNRAETRFDLTLDMIAMATLETRLTVLGDALCGAATTPSQIEIRRATLKVRRSGAIKLLLLARYRSTTPAGEKGAKLSLRLGGELDGSGSAPGSLEEALRRLGVRTDGSPRIDGEGKEIDDSHSPLGRRVYMTQVPDGEGGMRMVVSRTSEILLAGAMLPASGAAWSVVDNLPTGVAGLVVPDVLAEEPLAQAPWMSEQGSDEAPPATGRDGVAADVDGDTIDEIVFARVQGGGVQLIVSSVDGAVADVVADLALPASVLPIADVRLAVADFDGDGLVEFAVGASRAGAGVAASRVHVFDDAGAGFSEIASAALPISDPDGSPSLVLAPGNLDYDGALELAVVLNEIRGSGVPNFAAASWYAFDDTGSGFAELRGGPVLALEGAEAAAAAVADVTVADIDGDQLDEVILAGLDDIQRTCNFQNEFSHLLMAVDDALSGFEPIAASISPVARPQCAAFDSWLQLFVHVGTLDVDGDGDLEIQANEFIFDEIPPPGVDWDNIPTALRANRQTIFRDSEGGAVFSRANSAMFTADVNGDGTEDLVSYLEGNGLVEVYGYDIPDPDLRTFSRVARFATDADLSRLNPIVAAADVDTDGRVFEYARDYKFVFTEPVVLAALAAPPCHAKAGQNVDDCTTTWGRSATIGAEEDRSVTVSAGVTVGFKPPEAKIPVINVGVEAQVKVKFTASATEALGRGYELTKTTSFTTGPLEDSVVFFSVPQDVYTYRTIAHPDPEQVGLEYVISLSREPVTRVAERSYYNATIQKGAPPVDEAVFQHKPGVVDSYPSPARRTELLMDSRSQTEQVREQFRQLTLVPLFDPVASVPGLETASVGVGQGGGSTEVALELSLSDSVGGALELGFEFEAEATAGLVIAGFSVGASTERSFAVTRGEGSSYVGTVGSIDAKNFASRQYRFGLFTYLYADPDTGREFEVINYWVE